MGATLSEALLELGSVRVPRCDFRTICSFEWGQWICKSPAVMSRVQMMQYQRAFAMLFPMVLKLAAMFVFRSWERSSS